MAVVPDMLATWRGPGRVVGRLLAAGENEARALAILLAACGLFFVAQWPEAARRAHQVADVPLRALLGIRLFAVLFLAPVLFYATPLLISDKNEVRSAGSVLVGLPLLPDA
ncbi:MAG: hypothetical protein ACOY3Y_00050, partial [Acidobacteriota bacterium]